MQEEGLSEVWKERASKEVGEVEEHAEKQLKELAASLPNDWPLPRWKKLNWYCLRWNLFSGMISSSLNFCVPPLSTRFIHHHHFKTGVRCSWAGSQLVNAFKVPESEERTASVFCHQPPWSRQVWNILTFFVLKTKHPNLARLPIFVRYATIEQEWGQMLWHVEYYLFWLQLKAVFLNLVYFCCDTNATKAFLSRATVATGIIAVLPHRQQNCQTKISIIVYQKHNLRLCAHSCWSLEIFGSLDDH